MADVNAEIGVNIDTSGALAQLKALQREITRFHSSVARSSEAAALAQRDLQRNFLNGVNAIQGFSAELRTVRTTAENFTNSLERNKFSMREYFRYAGASTKSFGRFFTSEFDTINKVAVENVKRLQTQYIKMGRDANGAMRAIAVMPTQLDMSNLMTQTQLAAQRQAIFNQLVKQGSTNLLNFGKNTQWAGRQLMVGFTIPLIGLGSVATRTFMDMETAAIKFRKVYGDLFTPAEETQVALESIQQLGEQFTRYGIAVADTVSLAAEAAAAGFGGIDLQRQVTEATRLQVLGQIDQQKALETTISLQNAFRMSSEDLAGAINFLNAVENQTVVSLDDITTAIPKAAPIVRELGGDVKDLAFFMAAMKEGGINASEGANALKSGLASLINPSEKAKGMLNDMGIDIDRIVESNVGNLKATVIEFAQALDGLSSLQRQRAIEQLFGKFQQARLSALFDNVIRDGNQASRVLDLANASSADLAATAEKELGITADSAMNKFRASVEKLKISLAPIGEVFLQTITPLLDKLNSLLEWFNGLSDTSKKVITRVILYLGGLAPVILMTVGLLANFVANGIKGLMLLRNGFLRLTGQSKILGEQTNFLTLEQQNAVAAAASLEQSHINLQQVFTGEAASLRQLISEYQRMIAAQNLAATRFPGMMQPGFRAKKYAKGVVSVPGPKGAGDVVPSMLSPGEAVIPAKMAQKYGGLINGMISDNIPGFEDGRGVSNSAGLVFAHGVAPREIGKAVADALMAAAPNLQKKAFSQATSLMGLTNFGFIAPEALNKGRMTGAGASSYFSQNPELATSRILKSIYDLVPGAINDPAVKQDVLLFGENISRELATAGSKAVSEKDFYMHVERALADTMKRATSSAFRKSIPIIQSQLTTVAAYGGDINRGERGQRYALSRSMQTSALGYESGMTSYKASTLTSQIKRFGYTAGNAAVGAVAAGAATASPSRKTIQIGEDIARGLQVGMENQIDETRAVASKLSGTATTLINPRTGRPFTAQEISESRRVTSGEARGLVGRSNQTVFMGMPSLPERNQQPAKGGKNIRGSISRGVGRIAGAGGGFGLSGLFFGLSMLPGKIGEVAGSLTGLVFAGQALRSIFMVLPPQLKLVAAGAGLLYAGFKALSTAREKERQAIEGLGEAAALTEAKVKTLGDFFGIVPTKTQFETPGATLPLTPEKRTQVAALRENEAFQKEYAGSIKNLQNAAPGGVARVLQSITIGLQGKGFSQEQIKIITDALREEAGKTAIMLDFESVNLQTESGRAGVVKTIDNLAKSYMDAFRRSSSWKEVARRMVPTEIDPNDPLIRQRQVGGQYILERLVPNKEALREARLASEELKNVFIGLSGALSNGTITGKEFASVVNGMRRELVALEKSSPAAALLMVQKIIASLPEDAAKAATGVKTMSGALLVARLQAAGLAGEITKVASALIYLQQTESNRATNEFSGLASKVIMDAESKLAATEKIIEELSQGAGGNGGAGAGDGDGKFEAFKKELEALRKKRDAVKEVNDELDRQNQYQMKQMELINQASRAKISGDFLQAAQLQQQSMFEGAKFARESQGIQLDRLVNRVESRKAKAEERGSYNKKDLALLKKLRAKDYESIIPTPTTPGVGFNAGATGFSGSTTNVGGTMYTVTMNISGENADEIANKVINKLQVLGNKKNKSNKVR